MPYFPCFTNTNEIPYIIGAALVYSCYFYDMTSYQSKEGKLLHENYVPGLQLARVERREVRAINDTQLNQYVKQYNALRRDYQKNIRLAKKSKSLRSATSTYEIWMKISNCSIPRPEKYLKNQKNAPMPGTANAFAPTMADYEKLLRQYERDSIDAQYYRLHQQLVFQKYNQKKAK